jgi:hypothetical protein
VDVLGRKPPRRQTERQENATRNFPFSEPENLGELGALGALAVSLVYPQALPVKGEAWDWQSC